MSTYPSDKAADGLAAHGVTGTSLELDNAPGTGRRLASSPPSLPSWWAAGGPLPWPRPLGSFAGQPSLTRVDGSAAQIPVVAPCDPASFS